MRVLMFGWEFPPFNSGGLGVACSGITRALAKKGAKIAFVLPKKLQISSAHVPLIFADNQNSISIHEFDSSLRPYSNPETYGKDVFTEGSDRSYAPTLVDEVMRYGRNASVIAKNTPHDVIHAHDWLSFPAGIMAKKISRKPLIAHIHATEFDRTGGTGANPDVYKIEREGMEKADAVISVSQMTKDMIVGKYGISNSKIHVIHNGVNLDEYDTPHESLDFLKLKQSGVRMVLFVGRITIQKGPDYFIQVAKRVLAYESQTIFVVAGSGDMEYQMINLAANLGVSDKVFFVGYLRGKELDKVYRSSDIVVMPSVSEPFGITALEALAYKTPVMISKQSGVSEVLTHALKTDFWDIDEMANKIISILRYSSLQNSLRENGRKDVEKLTWDNAADKCLRLYQQLTV